MAGLVEQTIENCSEDDRFCESAKFASEISAPWKLLTPGELQTLSSLGSLKLIKREHGPDEHADYSHELEEGSSDLVLAREGMRPLVLDNQPRQEIPSGQDGGAGSQGHDNIAEDRHTTSPFSLSRSGLPFRPLSAED
jgi:hypothetical protein